MFFPQNNIKNTDGNHRQTNQGKIFYVRKCRFYVCHVRYGFFPKNMHIVFDDAIDVYAVHHQGETILFREHIIDNMLDNFVHLLVAEIGSLSAISADIFNRGGGLKSRFRRL